MGLTLTISSLISPHCRDEGLARVVSILLSIQEVVLFLNVPAILTIAHYPPYPHQHAPLTNVTHWPTIPPIRPRPVQFVQLSVRVES